MNDKSQIAEFRDTQGTDLGGEIQCGMKDCQSPGTPTRGSIRVHKALAWVHGPGMILTPALGILAFDQKSKGEHVHGLASLHGPVAWTTAIPYGVTVATVSFKF